MSDSPLEELEHHEHAEHAAHAAESGDKLISQVTFTIAVLAVVAAISASLETTESDAAIGAKNDAVLAQDQATTNWGLANSKNVRAKVYESSENISKQKSMISWFGSASPTSTSLEDGESGIQTRQTIIKYLQQERIHILNALVPGSTNLRVRDIVGNKGLFISPPWEVLSPAHRRLQ